MRFYRRFGSLAPVVNRSRKSPMGHLLHACRPSVTLFATKPVVRATRGTSRLRCLVSRRFNSVRLPELSVTDLKRDGCAPSLFTMGCRLSSFVLMRMMPPPGMPPVERMNTLWNEGFLRAAIQSREEDTVGSRRDRVRRSPCAVFTLMTPG